MLMPPDPTTQDEFDGYVHSCICAFGIHTHDKSITGRCHKPPTGIYRCSLSKPSGLVNSTKPIQLVNVTDPQTKPSKK